MSKKSASPKSISRRTLLIATSRLSVFTALLSNTLQAKSLLNTTESETPSGVVNELIYYITRNGLLWVAEHKLLLFEKVLFSHPDALINVLKDTLLTDIDLKTFRQVSALTDRKFKWLERKDTKNETFENWGKSISNTPVKHTI
ncbi:hypothetical protein JQC92_01945 [Shewanella sp. 202IG2-18]|uniref:hypothetical protein n=1 Tax=Parashewanella hymeniacidonis TaxID=2807618 RepID=UPI001960465F|nr:hypothetical protein [Parashewanella hymeniacidonis]MBM7070804.1 hypothetical protein [Parashewanella hymeniacidonis]